MGYFDNALDHGSTLRLQDCLQNDYPIRSMTMFFNLGGVVLVASFPSRGPLYLLSPVQCLAN